MRAVELHLSRRQSFLERSQHRQVRGALAVLVLERGIGTARQQQIGDADVAAFRRNHQRGTPSRIAIVDTRSAVEHFLDNLDRLGLGRRFIRAGGPHQEREIIGVAGVDIDVSRQQERYDIKPAGGRRVDDGRFSSLVGGSIVGAAGEQSFGNSVVATIGGDGERRW